MLAGLGPDPGPSVLAAAGLVASHWPAPWGLGADPVLQLVVDEELTAAGFVLPDNPIGIGWAGPTLLAAGTPEQQARWLPGILSGADFWCQLFSEPDAGSDLAALTTKAVRDGEVYVLNGRKCWNTWAERASHGILLARTAPVGGGPRHRGISYFVCPMDLPGIEVRVLTEMTGGHHFTEVTFDEVQLPVDCRVGAEGEGWKLARVTLGNERVSLSTGGVVWGMGPTGDEFLDAVRHRAFDTPAHRAPTDDPVTRQRIARVATEVHIQRLLGWRILTTAIHDGGGEPGPEASVKKALGDEHGQHVMGLAKDLGGAAGMLGEQTEAAKDDDVWHWGYLFAPALTIGGGTSEVQRNIVAERILGLPREMPMD